MPIFVIEIVIEIVIACSTVQKNRDWKKYWLLVEDTCWQEEDVYTNGTAHAAFVMATSAAGMYVVF